MNKKVKVLLIGESWMIHMVETKGFDCFSADSYGVGTQYIGPALTTDEIEFHHMPCHTVGMDFPKSVEGLMEYGVILISDVGANTFLLPVETFLQSKTSTNKLEMLKEYVLLGGGLCMIGGYLSFMGIEGKGRYWKTPVEEVLPVNFLPHDDRVERPEGLEVVIQPSNHEILSGLPGKITGILGYNRALAKPDCQVLIKVGEDPFLTIGEFGKGRSAAYATDCAPHWSSQAFCESEAYRRLWRNLVKWLVKK